MDYVALERGLVLGAAIAAPVGPIGTLVIRRSSTDGAWLGLSTGLGAAVADATYAAIGALGVAKGAGDLAATLPFRLLSAAMLFWLGATTLRSRRAVETSATMRPSIHAAAALSTFGLTLANPATIASFAAASAAIGIGAGAGPRAFVSGVFAGSCAWWIFLSFTTNKIFRSFATSNALRVVDDLAGLVLLAFGVLSLVR